MRTRGSILCRGAAVVALLLGPSCSNQEPDSGKLQPSMATAPIECVAAGHPSEALKHLSDLLDDEQLRELAVQAEKDPDSLVIDRFVEGTLWRRQWLEEALHELEHAETLAPTDVCLQVVRGRVLYELGRYGDACRAYERAIELDPKTITWRVLLLKTLFFADRFADAVDVYRRVLEVGLGNSRTPASLEAVAHGYGGWSLLYLERYADARESFEALLRVNLNDSEGHEGLACALLHLGLAEPAASELARTIELDPDSPTACNDSAVDYLERGHPKEALIDIDLALALAPRNELAHRHRGRALYELGRIEEALAAFDRALALREVFPEAHYDRGLALHALGRRAEAVAAFERALALDPTNADARRCREALR